MFDSTDNILANNDAIAIAAAPTNEPYGLDLNSNESIEYLPGTLRADNFVIASNQNITVISGNGNVNFGTGLHDTIDLSDISSDKVIDLDLAQTAAGGVTFDPGNGERVFDRLSLADGREILFEGIDSIVFSDGVEDLSIVPDDSLFAEQWNLHMMGVQNAWRFERGADDVLIGVQDSGLGVDRNGNFHPDLRRDDTWFFDRNNNLALNNNLADDFLIQGAVSPTVQTNSHGTAVQGIIAAESHNGMGIAGINWNSDVYNIDVLDGNVGDLSLEEATEAMKAQVDLNGQNLVINLSIQTLNGFDTLDPIHREFETVVADNPDVLFVVASGNFGHQGRSGLSSPAVLAQEYDNVIAVGASFGTSDRAGFNTTPGQRIEYADWGSQYGRGLTLVAPSEVPTTDALNNGRFDLAPAFDGTSAAAPNVTGVASLVWSANSELTPAEIKTILSETAYDLGAVDYDLFYGHGMINADAAMRKAIALGRSETVGV